jgi:hypothetical protein
VPRSKRRPTLGHGRADVERIGEAVSRPGIDPRTWLATGRVDTATDSHYFNLEVGWVIDVIAHGGSIHGAEASCRQGSTWPGVDGYGSFLPPASDEEVLIAYPGGDPEEDPIIIGVLPNGDGCKPPTTVAGRTIAAEGKTVPGGQIAASDCEFSKSPYSCVREWDGELHYRAKWVTIESGQPTAGIRLGSANAKSPVARADKLASAIGTFVDALTACLGTGSNSGGPVAFAGLVTLQGAAKQLAASLQADVPSPGVVVD